MNLKQIDREIRKKQTTIEKLNRQKKYVESELDELMDLKLKMLKEKLQKIEGEK